MAFENYARLAKIVEMVPHLFSDQICEIPNPKTLGALRNLKVNRGTAPTNYARSHIEEFNFKIGIQQFRKLPNLLDNFIQINDIHEMPPSSFIPKPAVRW
jgi:hypothetical protein